MNTPNRNLFKYIVTAVIITAVIGMLVVPCFAVVTSPSLKVHLRGNGAGNLYYFSASNNTTVPTSSTALDTTRDYSLSYDLIRSGVNSANVDGFIEISFPRYWLSGTSSSPEIWSSVGPNNEVGYNNYIYVGYDSIYRLLQTDDISSSQRAIVSIISNFDTYFDGVTNVDMISNYVTLRIDYTSYPYGHNTGVAWLASLAVQDNIYNFGNLCVRRRTPNDGIIKTSNWNSLTDQQKYFVAYGHYLYADSQDDAYYQLAMQVNRWLINRDFDFAVDNSYQVMITSASSTVYHIFNDNTPLDSIIVALISVSSPILLFSFLIRHLGVF